MYAQAANHTCGDYDRGVDEFEVSGLTPVDSHKVKPPRVRESAVQLECKLNRVIDFKDRCVARRRVGQGKGDRAHRRWPDGVLGGRQHCILNSAKGSECYVRIASFVSPAGV